MNDRHDVFERQLAAWGARPAPTPAEVASHRVTRGVSARPPRLRSWRLAAAAVLALGAALAVWRAVPPRGPAGGEYHFGSAMDETVVVWIVDPETTVLHVLEPSGSGKERTQ